MKEAAGVLAALTLLLGAVAIAVGPFGDRELFVSPPDAVAESFTREVMSKRWPRAKEYLRDPEGVPDQTLRAMQRELGEGENVEAETLRRDGTRAVVVVRVPSRNVVKKFELTFEGEWKIGAM